MALIRTKSNKSSSEDDQINDFPRPQTVTIKSPARTPTSHGMKAIGITQGQKQALIDNLQLESNIPLSIAILIHVVDIVQLQNALESYEPSIPCKHKAFGLVSSCV